MIYFYNLKLQYYNKNSVNGSNFDHIASISVHFNMKTLITKPWEQVPVPVPEPVPRRSLVKMSVCLNNILSR